MRALSRSCCARNWAAWDSCPVAEATPPRQARMRGPAVALACRSCSMAGEFRRFLRTAERYARWAPATTRLSRAARPNSRAYLLWRAEASLRSARPRERARAERAAPVGTIAPRDCSAPRASAERCAAAATGPRVRAGKAASANCWCATRRTWRCSPRASTSAFRSAVATCSTPVLVGKPRINPARSSIQQATSPVLPAEALRSGNRATRTERASRVRAALETRAAGCARPSQAAPSHGARAGKAPACISSATRPAWASAACSRINPSSSA